MIYEGDAKYYIYHYGCPRCGSDDYSRREWWPPEGFDKDMLKYGCRCCGGIFYTSPEFKIPELEAQNV